MHMCTTYTHYPSTSYFLQGIKVVLSSYIQTTLLNSLLVDSLVNINKHLTLLYTELM